jgi:hypothetical protein
VLTQNESVSPVPLETFGKAITQTEISRSFFAILVVFAVNHERNSVGNVNKRINPFYPLLVVVGLIFAFTACCYGVLMVNLLQPERAATIHEQGLGLLGWMDQHGLWILSGEIGLLAVLTFAAIGTDEYWMGDSNASQSNSETKN